MKKILLFLLMSTLGFCEVDFSSPIVQIERQEETISLMDRCKNRAAFYELEEGETLREITKQILESPDTTSSTKEKILKQGRRFFLFSYPSDGLQIKGYVSFVSQESDLIVFLRGGNRFFGLMHPANDFSLYEDYTVIGTTYRGGVSEGEDEFGGRDVNDVAALVAYLPTLEKKLGLSLSQNRKFLASGSRGGMEMFLALARFPHLQDYFEKAVSLSGLLDLRLCVESRPDMRRMFQRDFGLVIGQNEEEWFRCRDPMNHVDQIRRDFPLLILQGAQDNRTSPQEARNMVSALAERGCLVSYIEVEEGDHCLSNIPNRVQLIVDWLEEQ